jgi:hypothetical protein
MSKDAKQYNWSRKKISPVGLAHEALVELRNTFLSNVEIRVYQRNTDTPLLPINQLHLHPSKNHPVFLTPTSLSLSEKNERIQEIIELWEGEDDRHRRFWEMKSSKPHPLSPAEYSAIILKHWGYEGRRWVVADHTFEAFFPEDEGVDHVETHWYIPEEVNADRIELVAQKIFTFVSSTSIVVSNPPDERSLLELKEALAKGAYYDQPRWRAGIVKWGYLAVLDDAIKNTAIVARLLGDNPFLSSIGSDEHEILVIDEKKHCLHWHQRTFELGDNAQFGFLYMLGEFHGHTVPHPGPIKERGIAGDINALKNAVSNLRRRLHSCDDWSPVADFIKTESKGYRLETPHGVRLISE